MLGLLSSFGAFLGPGFTAWPASGSCSEGLAEGQQGLGRRRFPTDDGHERNEIRLHPGRLVTDSWVMTKVVKRRERREGEIGMSAAL